MAYKEQGGGYKGIKPPCIGEQGSQKSGNSGGGSAGYKGVSPKPIGEQTKGGK